MYKKTFKQFLEEDAAMGMTSAGDIGSLPSAGYTKSKKKLFKGVKRLPKKSYVKRVF